jgi:hypothetical protein
MPEKRMSLENDATLNSVKVDEGGLQLGIEGGACQVLVESLATQFAESGATNYLELSFNNDIVGDMVVTMQRVGGMTPGEKIAKMKELILAGQYEEALSL